MIAEFAGKRDESLQQARTEALATPGAVQVNGQVGHVLISWARVKRVQRGPADDAAIGLGDQDRMTWAMAVEPELGIGHSPRRSIQGGDTVRDALVMDVLNHRQIGKACRSDVWLWRWCERCRGERARHTGGRGGSNALELYRPLHTGRHLVTRQ